MQPLKKQLQQNLTLIFLTALFSGNAAVADSDMQKQEKALRAREMLSQQQANHAGHAAPIDKSLEFHGVFYGYLPCEDCNGIKTTLSLKQKDNYLIVTQPARDSSREYFEKGKYTWDEKNRIVVLTSRKDGSIKKYRIEDEGTIIQLNSDGTPIAGGDEDRYTLRRSDTVKSREVHIH